MAGTTTAPTLQLPANEQVAADGTIAVAGASYTDSFASQNAGLLYLTISDADGMLYAPGVSGAAGDGSDAITLQTSYADVQAIIAGLTYVATGTGGSDSIRYDIWNQAGTETSGSVPVTIGSSGPGNPGPPNGSSDPTLSEPASETLAAGATVTVSGSYSDSLAAGNPGAMYLSITDSGGTLRATNAAGSVVAGSGSHSITLNADYADVNAILASLTYTSGGAGSDSIRFDLWNQGGVETTGDVPVTITSGGGNGGPIRETWTGAVSSDWNTGANWSGGVVPAAGDTAVIGSGSSAPVLANATLSGETIVLNGGTLDFSNVMLNSALQGSGGTIDLTGTLGIGPGETVTTGALTVAGTADTVINNGTIAIPGTLDLANIGTGTSDIATLVNNGDIGAASISITRPLTQSDMYTGGLPNWQVTNNGIISANSIDLNGTVSGGTIALTGSNASLELERPEALTGGAAVSGFVPGDQIVLGMGAGDGGSYSLNNGTLVVTSPLGAPMQAIPLAGNVGLGSLLLVSVVYTNNSGTFTYEPQNDSTAAIVAPTSETVAAGGTLAVSGITIEPQYPNDSLGTLGITASTGTLYLPGAQGSGTHSITLSNMTDGQASAELANLAYVPAPGAASDVIAIDVSTPGPVTLQREIPITIAGSTSAGPTLTEPASESVAAGGTVAVAGRYSDSFASGNPGQLYLGISDSSGTLNATNAAGQAVAGSGSSSIAVQTDYVDVNAILASLHYTAGSGSGSDTIRFDIWNQAGTETTGAVPVTVTGASQSAGMSMADFASGGGSVGAATPSTSTTSSGGGALALASTPTPTHPIGLPLSPGQ